MNTYINLTPHDITVRTLAGDITYPASGQVARANQLDVPDGDIDGVPVVSRVFGPVQGVPDPEKGVILIVSAIVAAPLIAAGRQDVVAPDSGPAAIRQNGQIVAVLGWVRPA